jgi:hypothetical protein
VRKIFAGDQIADEDLETDESDIEGQDEETEEEEEEEEEEVL